MTVSLHFHNTLLEQANTLNPESFFSHLNLAAVYSELGREEAAGAEISEVLLVNPQYTLEAFRLVLPDRAGIANLKEQSSRSLLSLSIFSYS
jgi:hypothetical protein